MLKVYLKSAVFVLYLCLTFGFLLPTLFSAESDLSFALGALWLLLLPPVGYFAVKTIRKSYDKSRMIPLILIFIMMAGLSSCSKVPYGYQGIKVHLYGGSKGVDTEELGVGRYWIGWNEELFLFPTFMQNYVWTRNKTEGSPNDESITFQTMEGMEVNGDFGITYSIKPGRVSNVFSMYKRGIDEITDTFLRNMVRDALTKVASTMKVDTVYGEGKATLMTEVEKRVREETKEDFDIGKIYLIGSFRLPPKVVEALDAKIAATQKAEMRENEVREARAEADKAVAIATGEAQSVTVKAKAQSEANRILAASITPELIKYKSIERWSGALPVVMGENMGSLIQMDKLIK